MFMNFRNAFLPTMALLIAGTALPAALSANPGVAPKPNIILCMADDLGWGDTGYNGHPVLRTPHLDQMAKEGIRFDRFYSGAPVCSPTRGSCITGRHPYRYGIRAANVGHMHKEETTLAEVLKTQGYKTGHFGKWHLGTLTKQTKDSNRGKPGNEKDYSPPWEHGFDVSFSTEAKVPTYWNPGDYEEYGTFYWTGPEQMVPASEITGDDSTLVMDRALPFIRAASEQQTPFLAVIWFHAPHVPLVSVPPYTDGYDDEHKDYYGCITAMDEQIGRLRKELNNLGIEDHTMLWFCSDNGPDTKKPAQGITGGLRKRKHSLYEGGVRVPGILIWPEMVKNNRVVDMPCSTSDYFPTVLDALGYQLPEAETRPYDGISLLPYIKGEFDQRPRPIAFQSGKQYSLVDNRYKIYSSDAGETYELYDLVADRAESTDIAGQHPEVVAKMKEQFDAWYESCRDSARGKDY